MNKLTHILQAKLNIAVALIVSMVLAGSLGGITYVFASGTSNFTQTINAGTLSLDIVDGSYASVSSPTMAMPAATFSFACQSKIGYFGTSTQQIYVSNPDAAANGWTVSLAASSTADVWASAGTPFDFNDPTASGCTDSADTGDTVGGQMTVDPSVGSIAQGPSANGTTGLSLGSSSAFEEGVTDTITILTSDGTTDIGDWTLQSVKITQTLPAEQPAASDYNIDMVLSIAAS